MSRIADCFHTLQTDNRKAFVSFITAGDPNFDTSLSIMKALPAAGVDIIELGIPFSDPMADGPTIQAASRRALGAGMTLKKVLEMVRAFREEDPTTPVVLMGYYNPIYVYGVEAFVSDAKSAGVDGLIVVDVPPEHPEELEVPAQAAGLDFIRLLSPVTNDERVARLMRGASGFVTPRRRATVTTRVCP